MPVYIATVWTLTHGGNWTRYVLRQVAEDAALAGQIMRRRFEQYAEVTTGPIGISKDQGATAR